MSTQAWKWIEDSEYPAGGFWSLDLAGDSDTYLHVTNRGWRAWEFGLVVEGAARQEGTRPTAAAAQAAAVAAARQWLAGAEERLMRGTLAHLPEEPPAPRGKRRRR
jgi:hypothetical protein